VEFLRFGRQIIKASLIVSAHGCFDGTTNVFTSDGMVHRCELGLEEVLAILNQQWAETTTLGSPVRTFVPAGLEVKHGPGLPNGYSDSGDEQRD
jgi:hypothetical protein